MGEEQLVVNADRNSLVVAADPAAAIGFDVTSASGVIKTLWMKVTDAAGAVVYTNAPPIDCSKGLPARLSWDGERNQGAAALQDSLNRPIKQYVAPPLVSPYKVEVWADVEPAKKSPAMPPPGISRTEPIGEPSERCPNDPSTLTAVASRPASTPARVPNSISIVVLQPKVTLISVTPVFAPTKDDVDIVCKFENCDGVRSVLVDIQDYNSVLVSRKLYRQSEGELPAIGGAATSATFKWRMQENGASTAAADHEGILVRRSPYTVKVWASLADLPAAGDFSDAVAIHTEPAPDHRIGRDQTVVRCHSLRLELMPWADVYFDLTTKDAATVPVAEDRSFKIYWLKCKLNEMGFFAGPLTDDESDPNFQKALRRYRAMRLIPLDEHVVPVGAAVHVAGETPQPVDQYAGDTFYGAMYTWNGSNFVANTSGVDAGSLASDAAVDQLLVYLSMEKPWDPFDQKASFTDPAASVKLLLRSNRYYVANDTEWGGVKWDFTATENHCYSIARDWLSEPHLALRAILTVEDKQGAPQEVPTATRGVGVAWAWKDEDEALGTLPQYGTPSRIDASKQCASRTQEYVRQAWRRSRLRIPGVNAAMFHNTIAAVGGKLVNDNDLNAWSAFVQYVGYAFSAKKPAAGVEPGYVVTPSRRVAYQGGVQHSIGCVYLNTSIIAGDNYKVKLWFDFSDCGDAREAELKILHGKLTGAMEVNNAALPGGISKLTENRLVARESAKLTVWRQMTLAAFINWPERSAASSWNGGLWTSAEWDHVRNEYRDAYVDIPDFAARNACSIADFPNINSDYTAAMATITDRNGWEKPDLELELAKINLPAVNQQLLVHLGPERPVATGAKEVLELCEQWIASADPDDTKRTALVAAGTYYRTAVESVTEVSGADRIFRTGLTPGGLNGRVQGDFDAQGKVKSNLEQLNARLEDLKQKVIQLNNSLKLQYAAADAARPTNAEPAVAQADLWIRNTEADPVLQAVLREGGTFYKTAIDAVTEPGDAPDSRRFKVLNKAELTKRVQFFSAAGVIKAYTSPITELLKPMQSKLATLNSSLGAYLTPIVDTAELNNLAAAVAKWNARELAQWRADYPDWTDADVTEIKRAAIHYQEALAVMAQQANPAAPWTFRPGLRRADLPAARFTENAANRFVVRPETLQAALRLRPDGLFPFRLKNNKYEFVRAREAMMEAAAQIGFALSRLLHKTVRQKRLLQVDGGKFKALSDGAIMVDNITHPQITLVDGTAWTPFGLSMGSPLGVFFTSHYTPFRLYALGAHEWAHELIIQHWFNAGGAPKTEHDQSDMNCMMGYPYLIGQGTTLPAAGTQALTELQNFVSADGAPDKYAKFIAGNEGSFGVFKERLLPKNHLPHFCGKCNLQLRGWNVCAGGNDPVISRSSVTPDLNADAFPVPYNPLTFDVGNL